MRTMTTPSARTAATCVAVAAAVISSGIGAGSAWPRIPTPHEAAPQQDSWPQWRGPGGLGISPETGLPLTWSDTENLLWKTAIEGAGHSSPIVWGERLFLTTAIEGDSIGEPHPVVHMRHGYYDEDPALRERYIHPDSVGADRSQVLKVLALDVDDGSLVWERPVYEGLPFDDRHRGGSFASPTPVTDGHHVYAYFGSQGLYAFDFDGNLAWSHDLGEIPTWGLGDGSSPLLYGDLLIIVADRDNGETSFIVALDKTTGKERWRKERNARVQWSTPLLVEGPRGAELVVSGFQWITSYDPANGDELWRIEGLRGNVIATPVANADAVFVSVGHPRKLTRAIRLGGRGNVTGTPWHLWEYRKGTAYVPSNLVYGDQVYLVADNGMLTSLDAASGELIYRGKRVPVPGRLSASPVGFDGKILLSSQDGDMFVIKAGPEHAVLAVNSIDEAIWSSPAIAGGKLFVRGSAHLFCFADLAAPGVPR